MLDFLASGQMNRQACFPESLDDMYSFMSNPQKKERPQTLFITVSRNLMPLNSANIRLSTEVTLTPTHSRLSRIRLVQFFVT